MAASRERTTGVSSGRVPAGPVTSRVKGAAWSGWMSMKKKAGGAGGAAVGQLGAQVGLEERHRDHEHHGQAERDQHGAGVAAGAVEVGHGLAPGEGPPAAGAAARRR